MKWIIYFVFILINISINVKAVIEYQVLTNDLGDGTFKLDESSCFRPCKINSKPKRCSFIFNVEPAIVNNREVLAINNSVPGPMLNVCLDDIAVVEVHNRIPNQDLSIHWHGIDQIGSPYMDGVPMITQCPIFYYGVYKYSFRASKAGTFFYHAYSVSHQSDGVFGSLIVNQPSNLEPHLKLYDYDRSKEHTLLVSPVFENLLTGDLKDVNDVKPHALQINGEEHYKLFIMESFRYRFRLINAIGIDCPIIIRVDNHDITIIASDSEFVKPVSVQKVLLYPGERLDVVVKANQRIGAYWLHVNGEGRCKGLLVRAYLVYSGVNYTAIAPNTQSNSNNVNNFEENTIINGQMLQSLHDNAVEDKEPSIRSIYLGIDKSMPTETKNDFRYIIDAGSKPPFYPAALSIQNSIKINGKNFLYPNAPLLTQPEDLNEDAVCEVGNEKDHYEPQCIQILRGLRNEVIELVLVNEGAKSNDSYTLHMHGHSMRVLTTWQSFEDKPIKEEDFKKLDKQGLLRRNFQNPPLKDTISIHNKGIVIVRLKLQNPGSWLLECRSCGVSSLPTAILINVPQTLPKSVLKSLPKCGNYRPPDVLLN